jgi:mutual gliding-motility protein MglA
VFVADSQPEMMDANRESMANLEENLLEQGIRLERFPLVVQWNKRDLPTALSVEELRAALNPRGVPDFETEAVSGRGVMDALKAMTRLVIQDLRAKKIVPPPRAAPTPGAARSAAGSLGLEAQLSQHLVGRAGASATTPPAGPARPSSRGSMPALTEPPPAVPQLPTPQVVQPTAPPSLTGQRPLGAVSALAPSDLFDHARAAEGAFAAGDYTTCIQACLDAARRGLALAGESNIVAQAYLLHVDGGDLLKLQTLGARTNHRVDDAAFALYVLMHIFTRLHTAGLPAHGTE